MNRAIRLTVIGLLIITLAAIGLYWYLSYARSHYQATIKFNNTASAELVNTETESRHNISLDQPTVSLPYNADGYEIHYQTTPNYADGVFKIEPNQTDITIEPSLSLENLARRFQVDQSNIHSVIKKTYPNFNDIYHIESEGLYTDGTWYGAVLKYQGDGIFNRDNVGLILHKTDGNWAIITKPPMPSLHAPSLENVPLPVIESLNKSLHSN